MIASRRIIELAIAVTVLVIVFTAPLYSSQYVTALLITMSMYATLAVSSMIHSSYKGYINLGAAGFFGLGAYVTTVSWPHLPFPVIVVLGGLAAAVFAFAIGIPALRVRGPYFVILTFGLSQLLLQAFTLYEAKIVKVVGKMLLDPPSDKVLFLALAVAGTGAVLTAHFVKHSKFGIGLLSIRGDEEAAEAMGVNTTLYKLIAFAISSSFMGAVGAIMALHWTYIDPPIAFNATISFQVAIMSILGGLESFGGPIFGAIVLTGISEAFGVRFPYHYMIILGAILILLMKFLPGGLLGTAKRILAIRRSRLQSETEPIVTTATETAGGSRGNP